ncbi:MAG: peptidoglycan DD-metalloendopeptidase family protein [Clostridia bacterium]|nr:peptidoglycan DD-metalloendopeptidase family protein [Clostridia bacterium]
MLEYDRNLKIKYQNEKIELESDKKRLEEDLKYQEDLLKKLEEDKAEYEKLSKEQAEYIAALEKDISDANAAYEQAKAKENALDAELQQYLAELAEQQRQQAIAAQQGNGGGPYVGGNFIWPLYGYSYISSGFGWRTLNGYSDYHRGIDIPAPYGTPIHASKGGKVITATGHSSYGNYVVIDHGINSDGNGETTLYAHMSSIGCSVGQVVNQGDVIGYVGSTGYSTGNHTHFEVRINGTANNPLNFVSP